MENILKNLLSSIVSSANSVINLLLNTLMDTCFHAENVILKPDANGVQISLDGIQSIILSFSIGLIILKALKKGFDMYILWTERRIRATYRNIYHVLCASYCSSFII